ncbi:sigma-70 family RNA polymerase sigma factor [Nodosilinea sp. LEGE 07298]|uniref:sigma-70 family RNA polymerase sigma factor n=1 Tax=Nodosilinea sp. LEGE 07298 TaxID=2777970 RepID=UPI00187E8036|nr:sigma-70 family RNA polymerase sigma factor [Nodosilinea sp. LEGE 07298]MBE9113180.1 sigma-70 family RNA polymerase sigma factor [Nodosilinea sp. LEGE 07298]
MQLRTTVIDLFSTFIRFSGDRFDGWVSDWRLKKGMADHLTQSDQASQSEVFWALYWHKHWQAHAQAEAHLHAYLQEPCYWATQRITQRFAYGLWTLADGFQTAIAHTPSILKRYRPDYGSDLRAYAQAAFGNVIRNQLRQQHEANICSDWGLLRRLSQTQLQRSLLAAGVAQTESAILVWQCFKAVCQPDPQRSVRALPPPTADQLAQMAERYNRQRVQLSPMPARLRAEDLMASLQQVVQAARAYLAPTVVSLNQPQFDQAGPEPLDTLSDGDGPMQRLLAEEAYAEQQRRVQQLEAVLGGAIAAIAPADQTLLRLYYREDLTQAAIAQQLQIQQYQVSRRLSRVRQRLLVDVARWSQKTLHIDLDSTVLASMSDAIHEWLQRHYQKKHQNTAEDFDELGV